jgi:hypothetical protein
VGPVRTEPRRSRRSHAKKKGPGSGGRRTGAGRPKGSKTGTARERISISRAVVEMVRVASAARGCSVQDFIADAVRLAISRDLAQCGQGSDDATPKGTDH